VALQADVPGGGARRVRRDGITGHLLTVERHVDGRAARLDLERVPLTGGSRRDA
jgi:hypothetical protein